MEALEDRRMLAVFTVTNLNDSGAGSLRDAIARANSLAGHDGINFSVAGTIGLTSGELNVNDTLTLDGPGITIDARQNSRVLRFSNSTGNLTLQGLTLTGGRIGDKGGGIRFDSNGLLTLTTSTVSGNSTHGNFSDGGGIFSSSGNVTVAQSTISGNRTDGINARGGGIFVSGDLSVNNSTISGNRTIGLSSDGGGIFAISGDVTVASSTISGNRTERSNSYGGGIYTSGDLTVTNSTISGNSISFSSFQGRGGGIYVASSAATILNSIIAGNIAHEFTDIGGGPFITFAIDYSLIGDANGTAISGTGNIIGNSQSSGVVDPRLAPLSNNGGPTATHALLLTSPARDAGNSALTTDQRGQIIPVDLANAPNAANASDMGAFEVQWGDDIPMFVSTIADTVDGDYSPGQLSLREAISIANSDPGPNTIQFESNLSGSTIALSGTELDVTESLTIDASALTQPVTIDAQQQSKVLHFSGATGNLTLDSL